MTATADIAAAAIAEFRGGAWFAACGDELTDAEIEQARIYVSSLGFAGVTLARCASWDDAKRITCDPRWSRQWLAAEQAAYLAAHEAAARRHGDAAVLDALTRIMETTASALIGAAAVAASRGGVADPGLSRAAAGAASESLHRTALFRFGAAAHAGLVAKHALFLAGRWPLAIVGDSFFIL